VFSLVFGCTVGVADRAGGARVSERSPAELLRAPDDVSILLRKFASRWPHL